LLRFHERYPESIELALETNYRSTPKILRFANKLLHQEPGVLQLVPARESVEETQEIVYATFHNDEDEANQVARQIYKLIQSGEKPENIAVLFRMNAQSALIEQELSKKKIPYLVQGTKPFFERPEIREAIMLLRGAAFGAEDQP